MRYSEGKCSADIQVRLNGISCQEYDEVETDGSRQCWIVAHSRDSLSVDCSMCINAESYQVDLFTDGKLRHTWVSNESEEIDEHEEIEFDEGVSKNGRSWYEGTMRVSNILHGTDTLDYNRPTSDPIPNITSWGTVAVRISKPDGNHTYLQQIPNSGQANRNGDRDVSGVLLTHVIKLKKNRVITGNKRLRARLAQPRPGKAPWATFVFLYRTEEALRKTGHLKLSKHGHNLNATSEADGSDITAAARLDRSSLVGNNSNHAAVQGAEHADTPIEHTTSDNEDPGLETFDRCIESNMNSFGGDDTHQPFSQTPTPVPIPSMMLPDHSNQMEHEELQNIRSNGRRLKTCKTSPDCKHVDLHNIPQEETHGRQANSAGVWLQTQTLLQAPLPVSTSSLLPTPLSGIFAPQATLPDDSTRSRVISPPTLFTEPNLPALSISPPSDQPSSRRQTPLTSKRLWTMDEIRTPESGSTTARDETDTPKRRRRDLEDLRARVSQKRKMKEDASRRRQEEEQRLEQRKRERRTAQDTEWAQLEREQAELEHEIAKEEEGYQALLEQRSDSEENE